MALVERIDSHSAAIIRKLKNASPERKKACYREYLQTTYWAQVKAVMRELACNRCERCSAHGSQAKLNVHHRTYRRLGEEEESDLLFVCDDCHGYRHIR